MRNKNILKTGCIYFLDKKFFYVESVRFILQDDDLEYPEKFEDLFERLLNIDIYWQIRYITKNGNLGKFDNIYPVNAVKAIRCFGVESQIKINFKTKNFNKLKQTYIAEEENKKIEELLS